MFDDLKEICDELSNLINKNEVKLIENNNNLNIFFALPSTKIKQITFELNEDKNEKNKNNDNNELIIYLQNEIKEIKCQNKKEIDKLKNIINNQKKEIEKNKTEIK